MSFMNQVSIGKVNQLSKQVSDNAASLATKANQINLLKENRLKSYYGAIGDGTLHQLSSIFPTLVLAQMKYPCATALTDSIDWCAIQQYINDYTGEIFIPTGTFVTNKTITLKNDRYLKGTIPDYVIGTCIQLWGHSNCTILTNEYNNAGGGDNTLATLVGIENIRFDGDSFDQDTENPGVMLGGVFVPSYMRNCVISATYGPGLVLKYGSDIKIDNLWLKNCVTADHALVFDNTASAMVNIDHLYIEWTQCKKLTAQDLPNYASQRYTYGAMDQYKGKAIYIGNGVSFHCKEMHTEGHTVVVEINGNTQDVLFERIDCSFLGDATRDSAVVKFMDSASTLSFQCFAMRVPSPNTGVKFVEKTQACPLQVVNVPYNSVGTMSNYLFSKNKYVSSPTLLTQTIYVNSTTGSDYTGDGTSSKPFATLQNAINSIPNQINGQYNIVCNIINTNDISIQNFIGGVINITKDTNFQVNSLTLNNNSTRIIMDGIHCVATTRRPVYIENCQAVEISNFSVDGADTSVNTGDGIRVKTSRVIIKTTAISNRRIAVSAAEVSEVWADTISGSGNTYGYMALAGTLRYTNNTVTATTMNLFASNGTINNSLT